jgi:hypothetical protein
MIILKHIKLGRKALTINNKQIKHTLFWQCHYLSLKPVKSKVKWSNLSKPLIFNEIKMECPPIMSSTSAQQRSLERPHTGDVQITPNTKRQRSLERSHAGDVQISPNTKRQRVSITSESEEDHYGVVPPNFLIDSCFKVIQGNIITLRNIIDD